MGNPILTAEELQRFAEYEKRHNLQTNSGRILEQINADPDKDVLFAQPDAEAAPQKADAPMVLAADNSQAVSSLKQQTPVSRGDKGKHAVMSQYKRAHTIPKWKEEENRTKGIKPQSYERPKTPLNKPQRTFKPTHTQVEPTLLEPKKIPIGDWITWSCAPHNDDEIRRRLLTTPITNTCISYLCRYSTLSPEFLEEFIALSTGWFHMPGNDELAQTQPIPYTPENLEFVEKLCSAKLTMTHAEYTAMVERGEIVYPKQLQMAQAALANNSPAKLSTSLERMFALCESRVDWLYLQRHQTLPQDFIEKYAAHINKTLLADKTTAMAEINESLHNFEMESED